MRTIIAADLFCGAGGSSTGLKRVADAMGVALDLTAVNHWQTAVDTHAANHPDARHVCEDIDSVVPRRVTGGKIDVLWASPACTEHSYARGDVEMSAGDQSRATAWSVLRWIDETRPEWVFIENVPALSKWGPLGRNNRPIASRRGETYQALLTAIRSRGYTVDARVLNSANYGAATSRPRLFIACRFDGARARGPIPWPAPTHTEAGTAPLFSDLQTWRGAREIIDWTDRGTSIFNRKRPLVRNTLDKISDGATEFWGLDLQPFLVAMEHGGRTLDVNRPLPVITTAKGGAFGVLQPFVIGQQSGSTPRQVSEPMPTVSTKGAISVIEAFLVNFYGSGSGLIPQPVSRPLPTVTTKDRFGLVQRMSLDVTFRMLRPHELAAAMGFPVGYQFAGTKTDAVRQIGNAVEVNQAAALWAHPVEQVAGRRRAA